MVVGKSYGKVRMTIYCLLSTEFQFGKMEEVLEMDAGDGCTTV
jgi:hypothetical protein